LQRLFAHVEEIDEGRVDTKQGVRLPQYHLPDTGALTPAAQLLFKPALDTTEKKQTQELSLL